MQIRAQIAQEGDRRSGLDVRVEVILELERDVVYVQVGDFGRCRVKVRDHVNFEVGCERIRELHGGWEGVQDKIAELDAVWWDDVAELVVAAAEKLRKVVEENLN